MSFVARVKDLNISRQSYALLVVLITLPSDLGLVFSKSSSKSEIILNIIGVVIIRASVLDLVGNRQAKLDFAPRWFIIRTLGMG